MAALFSPVRRPSGAPQLYQTDLKVHTLREVRVPEKVYNYEASTRLRTIAWQFHQHGKLHVPLLNSISIHKRLVVVPFGLLGSPAAPPVYHSPPCLGSARKFTQEEALDTASIVDVAGRLSQRQPPRLGTSDRLAAVAASKR